MLQYAQCVLVRSIAACVHASQCEPNAGAVTTVEAVETSGPSGHAGHALDKIHPTDDEAHPPKHASMGVATGASTLLAHVFLCVASGLYTCVCARA